MIEVQFAVLEDNIAVLKVSRIKNKISICQILVLFRV